MRVEPLRDLRAFLVPAEHAVAAAGEHDYSRTRSVAFCRKERELRIQYVADDEIAFMQLDLGESKRFFARLALQPLRRPQAHVSRQIVLQQALRKLRALFGRGHIRGIRRGITRGRVCRNRNCGAQKQLLY